MADARATHTASLLTNGTVLVAGGTLSQDAITSEIFNPTTGLFPRRHRCNDLVCATLQQHSPTEAF